MPRDFVLSETDYFATKRAVKAVERGLTNLRNRLRGERGRRRAAVPPARVRFYNENSGTAPAYGVMRITTNGTATYAAIDKPSSAFQPLYIVNGPRDCVTGKWGWGYFLTAETFRFDHRFVLFDTANTPAVGEVWGPQDGTWTIKQNYPGFLIIGGNTGSDTTSRTAAMQLPCTHVIGKANGSIAVDATNGTMDIWSKNFGGATGQSLSGIVANWSVALASGDKMTAALLSGAWTGAKLAC
jgi:hypothetical protein